ncbi:hypothetical protein ACSBR2_036977 [Camellia fascicularis]
MDGLLLATVGTKGTLIRIFNTMDRTKLQEVRRGVGKADIFSIALSPNVQWLVVSSDKGTVHLFSLRVRVVGEDSSTCSSVVQIRISANLGSSLSFMKGLLPKNFSSEWSFAQFYLPEYTEFIAAFGSQNTVIIVGMDGSNYVGFSVIIMVTSNNLSLSLSPLLYVQPVVDAFDPSLLVAPAISHTINFTSIKSMTGGHSWIQRGKKGFVEWNYYFCNYGTAEIMDHKGGLQGYKNVRGFDSRSHCLSLQEEELYEIDVPLKFKAPVGTRIHGLACWFDVLFDGRWLSTPPGAPTTHWYQLRCVFSQPLYVMPGQEITGQLHMIAHNAQSYSINLTMTS